MNRPEISVECVVPFHDLDPMNVVWHGNYARYFEVARTALMQSLDYDIPQMRESGLIWPIIELNTRFARPMRYQQRVRVTARLMACRNWLKIAYTITDAQSGERLTRGHTLQAACDRASGEMLFEVPLAIRQRLGVDL
ncbi:acyl-CoA thioesterase [Chitinibacteraceae bacterium HSL-7]